jgi:hypothetical protein
MPVQIEWRLTPNPQHAGSAELRGPTGTPFLYVHPQDGAQQPRRSSSARWIYDHQDAAEAAEVADAFTIRTAGWVSFARYMASRNAYLALANPPDPWRGQESADEVYTANPVTGIQPSGQANYCAYISLTPASEGATRVTLIAELRTWALGYASQPLNIGMGQRIVAQADAENESDGVARVRSAVRLSAWSWFKRDGADAEYDVVIPPGGEVRIGSVNVGPAYEIRGGTSLFAASSRIGFRVKAIAPL